MTLMVGLKLTHDGGAALVDIVDGRARLVGVTEAEKVANGRRHAALDDDRILGALLSEHGVGPRDVDLVVVDGWGQEAQSRGVNLRSGGVSRKVLTGPYRQTDDDTLPFHRYWPFGGVHIGERVLDHTSFRHAESHVASAFVTRPSEWGSDSTLVLVWDGGLFPEVYVLEPGRPGARWLGALFGIPGSVYSGFACRVPPFLEPPGMDDASRHDFHLTIPGKVMAYAGLGKSNADLVADIGRGLHELDGRWDVAGPLFDRMEDEADRRHLTGADLLASFQEAVGDHLVAGLERLLDRQTGLPRKLCYAGGSALNIKWNSKLRDAGLVDALWIPPFPNDCGTAFGAAAASLLADAQVDRIDWTVYRGPGLVPSEPAEGWSRSPCTPPEVGYLLAEKGEPVVILADRAELGPRALGHRSILAPADSLAMKDRLNLLKGRENYRPVAPLCLESEAAVVFDPGGRDPYMLYEHRVRDEWVDRVPAVVHADRTARLQTATAQESPLLAAILTAYLSRTGIPVLCNTSANLPGRGFFPDVASATRWARTRYVWSEGFLYTHESDFER